MRVTDEIKNERTARARKQVSERFLKAVDVEYPQVGGIEFPAYLSLRGIRINNDNSLSVTFTIPANFMQEVLPLLPSMCEQPLACTAEIIELPDA